MPSASFEIFHGVPDDVVAEAVRGLPVRDFAPGDILLRENEVNRHVFLIESGELDVWKGPPRASHGVCVARLGAGDCFGEMSALNATPSSATILAAAPARVRLLLLSELPAAQDLREQVTRNLARTLVQRLSRANDAIREKHEREMKAMRVVTTASAFITRILVALTCYMFSFPLIELVTPHLPSNSLVSFFFIIVISAVVVNFKKRCPEVAADHFFMTTQRWPRQIFRGLLWAIPPMLVFVAIKLTVIHAHPGKFQFFEPMSAIARGAPLNIPLWLGLMVTYTVLSFAQEFIRCAAQGTLQMINSASGAVGPWKAILVSDVLFASLHMHLGGWFAVQAAIGGLFFGYEFWRERSYLAVAVSHSLVGVWAVFIVGVPR